MAIERYRIQQQIDPSVVRVGTGTINPNVIGKLDLSDLASSADRIQDRVQDRLDFVAVRDAAEAGSTAGMQDDYAPRADRSLSADAYNRAGNEIFINRTVTDLSARIAALGQDPSLRSNPEAFRSAVEELKAKVLPNVPPTLIPEFSVNVDQRAMQYMNRAAELDFARQTEENKVALADRLDELAQRRRSLAFGDADALKEVEREFDQTISGQVGITIDPEQAAKARKEFRIQGDVDQAVKGMTQAATAGERAAIYATLTDSAQLDAKYTPEERSLFTEQLYNTLSENARLDKAAEDSLAAANATQAEQFKNTIVASRLPGGDIAAGQEALRQLATLVPETEYADYDAIMSGRALTPEAQARYNYRLSNLAASQAINAAIDNPTPDAVAAIKADPASPSGKMLYEQALNPSDFKKDPGYRQVIEQVRSDPALSEIDPATGQPVYSVAGQRVMEHMYAYGSLAPKDGKPHNFVREYNLAYKRYAKPEQDPNVPSMGAGPGATIKVYDDKTGADMDVTIPQHYLDAPELYMEDLRGDMIRGGLATPEVARFLAARSRTRTQVGGTIPMPPKPALEIPPIQLDMTAQEIQDAIQNGQ